jgi:hypothetical protein
MIKLALLNARALAAVWEVRTMFFQEALNNKYSIQNVLAMSRAAQYPYNSMLN